MITFPNPRTVTESGHIAKPRSSQLPALSTSGSGHDGGECGSFPDEEDHEARTVPLPPEL